MLYQGEKYKDRFRDKRSGRKYLLYLRQENLVRFDAGTNCIE